MDPLNISSTAISLATSAFQVAKALYGFYTSSKDVDATIQGMHSGIVRIEELCRHIDKHIKLFPQAESGDADNEDLFQAIQSQLLDCSKVINRINSKLEPIIQHKTGTWTQLKQQWRFNMRQEDINQCRTQIQTNVQNLQISLQLVNLQATYLAPKLANKNLLKKLKEIQMSLNTHGADQKLQNCAGAYLQKGTSLYSKSVASSVGDWQDASHPKAIADWLEQINSLRIQGSLGDVSSPLGNDFYCSAIQSDQTASSDTTNITDSAFSTLNPIQDDEGDEFVCEVAEAAIKSGRQAYSNANYLEAEEIFKDGLSLIQRLPRDEKQQFDLEEIHLLLALCVYHNHDLIAAEAALVSTLERDAESEIHVGTRFLAAECLTIVYIRLGKYDLARITCDNVYRGRRKVFGKDNDACYGTIALLVRIYELQDLFTRANVYRSMIPNKKRDKFCTRYRDLSSDGLRTIPQQIKDAPWRSKIAHKRLDTPRKRWKISSQQIEVAFQRKLLVSLSHNTWKCSNNGDKMALARCDSKSDRHAKIEVYNNWNGSLLHKLSVENETAATAFDFHEDGQKLASGHGGFWYAGNTCRFKKYYKQLSIYIWDIVKGHRLQKITLSLNQTNLWISALYFHHERLEFLRCLSARKSYMGGPAPGFVAMDLNGSTISDIKGSFSSLKRDSHDSRRIILKDANEFTILDTTDYATIKKIKDTRGIGCVYCADDGTILVLLRDGKLETYKDDTVTSQQLLAANFKTNARIHDSRIRCVSDRTMIAIRFSNDFSGGFYIMSLQDRLLKRIDQDNFWVIDYGFDSDGKYLFIFMRRLSSSNTWFQVLDLESLLKTGQKLNVL